MTPPEPSFSVEDLLTWIAQGVRDLEVVADKEGDLTCTLGFDMMLCVAICSAIPGAKMFTVQGELVAPPAGIRPPTSYQRFVIQFRDHLIVRGQIMEKASLDEMVCHDYREEIDLHAPSLIGEPVRPDYDQMTQKDLSLFPMGTWTQFLANAIAARLASHLTASELERSTSGPPPKDGSPPRRI